MTPLARLIFFTALCLCMAPPAWSQQYLLYTPQPVTSGQKAAGQEGILVQEIKIQKGDTLAALSRKFSGRGMYFPQILLFNSIKNPDLIYAGNKLRVPVTQKNAGDSDRMDTVPSGAAPRPKHSKNKKTPIKAEAPPPGSESASSSAGSSSSTELSLSDLKTVRTEKNGVKRTKKKTAARANKNGAKQPPAVADPAYPAPVVHKNSSVAVPATDAQKLFGAAVKAYQQDDCRTALELLDRFLADNSGSPQAADANLYKADCYLKLSAQ